MSVRLLAPPSPRGCGTLCAVPSATGAAADILLFGGSCGWEAEAARATTFLGDTHRLPLGEVLDALDQSAATAATTAAAAAAAAAPRRRRGARRLGAGNEGEGFPSRWAAAAAAAAGSG